MRPLFSDAIDAIVRTVDFMRVFGGPSRGGSGALRGIWRHSSVAGRRWTLLGRRPVFTRILSKIGIFFPSVARVALFPLYSNEPRPFS